ncbi:MAG: SOS response-associated peptidase [Phycisphaerales bacterium]|nr:MAG: SOS response-associated peptidase [Phycisphaerales bacterium]
MCGRYTLISKPDALSTLLRIDVGAMLPPRYNIAPTQSVPVLRNIDGQLRLDHLTWGFIPSWAKSPAIGPRLINARSETAATKPAFRAAMRERRCLIPASGFYEWKREGLKKQPFYIRRRDGRPFVFAGLWTVWTGENGEQIESSTILTTLPNEMIRQIHDRMPVILDERGWDTWLHPVEQDLKHVVALLAPTPTDNLDIYPVSPRVNSVVNDDASCIEPVSLAPAEPHEDRDHEQPSLF